MSVFVATLGWSRAAYVEFVTDERLETLLALIEGWVTKHFCAARVNDSSSATARKYSRVRSSIP